MKKFDQESKNDKQALLQEARDLTNDQTETFPYESLIEAFLVEISSVNELNWENNKLTMQASGQALSDAISGVSIGQGRSVKVTASEDMVAKVQASH